MIKINCNFVKKEKKKSKNSFYNFRIRNLNIPKFLSNLKIYLNNNYT